MQEHTTDAPAGAQAPDGESTGHAGLDKRLSAGVLKGDSGTDTAQIWISAFLIAALGFLVYLGAFSIPLHGEDLRLFHDSTALHRLVTAPDALDLLPASPLSAIGLAALCSLTGGRVDALHGFSVLLHLCCAILVFLIARRLLPKGTPEVVAMLAGMVFVAHPALAGAVSYLYAYPVLQAAFFGLAALALLLRGADQTAFCVASLAGAVACFVLAFGSDTSALLLPLLGIGLLRLRSAAAEGGARFVRIATPTLVLLMAVLWVAGNASGILDRAPADSGAGARLAAFVGLSGKILGSVLWPAYPGLLPDSGGLSVGLPVLAVLVAGVVYGFLFRPLVGQVALWTLVGALSVACYGLADRAATAPGVYLSAAGLAILVPWGLLQIRVPGAFRIAAGIAAAAILLLSFITFQRTNLWKDPAALWRAEADRHPDSIEPWLAAGRFLWARAQTAPPEAELGTQVFTDAAAPWRAVLDREPGHPEAEKMLGMIQFKLGDFAEAEPLLVAAVAREPENPELALYVAFVREQQARAGGDREKVIEALRGFRRAAQLGPLPAEAKAPYGMLTAGFGDYETALPLLQDAVAGAKDSPLAEPIKRFQSLAEQSQALGQRAETALQQRPESSEGLLMRAEKLLVEGRTLSAFYLLQFTLDRSPDLDAAWALLGVTSARMAGTENFLAEWGPSRAANKAAWEQLAGRCALGGAWDAAETYLRYGSSTGTDSAMPELALADIAQQLRQTQRAAAYLEAARKAYPDNPLPWLKQADINIAASEFAQARTMLDEAEKRGAALEELQSRRDKLVNAPASPAGIERTVIQ